jgi:mitogen-activated protein kinase kinase
MKRPTSNFQAGIKEEEEEEVDGKKLEDLDNEESTETFAPPRKTSSTQQIETADKVVSEWVISSLERRNKGTNGSKERPALHAVALDAVPGSPLLDDPATISPTRK